MPTVLCYIGEGEGAQIGVKTRLEFGQDSNPGSSCVYMKIHVSCLTQETARAAFKHSYLTGRLMMRSGTAEESEICMWMKVAISCI